ncbi:lipopolysaccharide biosynthesis protein [Roseateles albus]|uniref:Oligosaccharide flippase family protein n=1 Tax=Roseateles albus TaxID=2987525 RepID=A0ABT5KE34_9BURK|nr:oligosaccharide flippase family protein [Roseateles albus]MDC8772075.1 oligosaccharide flippase family protein [Roseateles albus]
MGLGRKSAWLGIAQVIELALQVLLPVLLVRHLTVEDFGSYRLLWLIAGTAATMLPMAMPDVLAVMLPSASVTRRRSLVAWSVLYMAVAGVTAGLICGLGLFLASNSLGLSALLLPAATFTSLWMFGVLLDYLPLADERPEWQAKVVICLAAFRAVAAGWAAFHFGQAEPVFWALVLTAAAKACLLLYYTQSQHSVLQAMPLRADLVEQWRRALPLGISGLLFGLRRQVDQWIVAAMFSVTLFASFSLAAVFGPLVFMARRAVSGVLLPTMSRLHTAGDIDALIETNHRANLAVAFIAFPVLAFIWCFGEPIYTLIYTDIYLDAVPVMRVLTIVWLVQVVDMNGLVLLFNKNGYVARINLPLLVLSAVLSAAGGLMFGIIGAAFGTVVSIVVERWLIVRCLASHLGISALAMQPWLDLVQRFSLCWVLGLLARALFEVLKGGCSVIVCISISALVAGAVYLGLCKLLGWFPKSLSIEGGYR